MTTVYHRAPARRRTRVSCTATPQHHNTCTLSHCLVALVLDDGSMPSGPRTPQDPCQLHRYTTTPTCTLSHCLVALVLDDDSIPSGPIRTPQNPCQLHRYTTTPQHQLAPCHTASLL
ncbi:unnamed protein product [Parnassius apollo]|uniref:(apollo) hypothetical protein n=1 Tax=Parnassius apollo TaxID=110799 RepID=A0A8S3Y3B1_PARAO|nr:unnamed protein product [Parnassius apollo]